MGTALQRLFTVSENLLILAKAKTTEKERSAIPEYKLKPWDKPTGKRHELKWRAIVGDVETRYATPL